VHAFLVREWNLKTKILNMFFLIFSLCNVDIYFCAKNKKIYINIRFEGKFYKNRARENRDLNRDFGSFLTQNRNSAAPRLKITKNVSTRYSIRR
jgi:hypothetical protein